MHLAKLPGRRWQRPPIDRDRQGRCHSLPDDEGRLPHEVADRRTDDPIRRALQYRWLSTDQWLVDLGLLEACGSRHDVDLVLIQAEQGYWAGDFDSYGRAPTWLRRLHARDEHR
jgi:hypothetical protein